MRAYTSWWLLTRVRERKCILVAIYSYAEQPAIVCDVLRRTRVYFV